MALTDHESALLPKALDYAKQTVEETGKLPTMEDFRKHLGCAQTAALAIRRHIVAKKLVAFPPEPELKEKDEVDGEKRVITLPRTRIHTLEELVEFCKIDTTVWEVERFIANKWEMGYKDAEKNAGHYPLYQIKAFLRRRHFATTEGYIVDNARLRSQVEKLRVQVASEREMVKRLARNHAGYDDLLANFKEFANVMGDFSLPYQKPEYTPPLVVPCVRNGHTEDAVMLLSDTHFGDRIRREDTSGFPEFDLIIGGNRMGYVIQKAKQVLTLHRAMYPIKKLYIWVGGDIGNGILHDSPNSNELFPPAQVHFSYHMLKFAIEDLLTLTVPDPVTGVQVIEEIVLLFTVGNHMRMDEKMPHKYQAQRTLDWLIYQFVIDKFSSHPKVRIRTEMSPFIFEDIRGHRHLFCHGMQVGYKNNPDTQIKAVGGFLSLVRGLFDSPEWRRKTGLEGETFSRACIGDIHVPLTFPRFKSNGSLNGQNELGVNWTLEPIPAGQQLFGVADKHQETWSYFLDCSAVQKSKGDFNKYGHFAAEYARLMAR